MIEINLLPVREERRKAGLRQLGILLASTLVGSVALTGTFHAKLRSDVGAARAALVTTQQQIDEYKDELARVEEYRKSKEQIERKLGVIEQLQKSRSGPVLVMGEIASQVPERLWLTRLQTRGATVTLEGLSLDNELVASFLTALNSSRVFQGVELEETKATQVEGLKLNEFKLSGGLAAETGAAAQETAAAQGMPAGTGR